MNALETASSGAPTPAARSNRNDVAAPSQSETEQLRLVAAVQAFSRLNDAADSCDYRAAQKALDEAAELLGVSDSDPDIEQVITAIEPLTEAGSLPATRAQVATAVATLIGAFPNFGNKAEARLFGKALAEDVAATEPSSMALPMMVRAIRRRVRFVPTIAEVLGELETAERTIAQGATAIEYLADRWERARAHVERLTKMHEDWMSEQVAAYQAAKAAGGNVRAFPTWIIEAAEPPGDGIPF